MVLALVVGDLHVPQRAACIPESFRKMFLPGRIQYVFINGNVASKDMLDYLRTIAPEVHCTRGEWDHWHPSLPDTVIETIEGVRIGMVHGHQVVPAGDKNALAVVQRQLDVDVLISGATHAPKIFEFDSHLFVNPGSATGAFTGTDCNVTPSFVLLDIRGKSVTAFTYYWSPQEVDANNAEEPMEEGAEGGGGVTDVGVRIKKKEWSKS